MRITIPLNLVEMVHELEHEGRRDVERLKEINEFDTKLAELFLDRRNLDPGIVKPAELALHFSETIDIIIQVIAHCENPSEVSHVTEVIRYVGRIHQMNFTLPQDFDSLLRKVIREIDANYGYVTSGINDRLSVRRKARAIVRKIEEALNHRGI